MGNDDIFAFWFGKSEPEARIAWSAPRELQLTRSDEELIEAVIYEMVEWRHDPVPAGAAIRMLLTLDGTTERVTPKQHGLSRGPCRGRCSGQNRRLRAA